MRFEYTDEEVIVEAEPFVVIVYRRQPRKTYTHYDVMVLEDMFTSSEV